MRENFWLFLGSALAGIGIGLFIKLFFPSNPKIYLIGGKEFEENDRKVEKLLTFAFPIVPSKKNKKLLIAYCKGVVINKNIQDFIDECIDPWAKKVIYSHVIKNA